MDPKDIDRVSTSAAPKLASLKSRIGQFRSAVVAFSGGVDSTFLLHVAHEVLGEGCVAVTAMSPSVSERDKRESVELAARIGARQVLVESRELADPRYAANPTNRCYFCKSELYTLCAEQKARLGIDVILDGFNADEMQDHRPGRTAALEQEIVSPLAEAGLSKDEIRALSFGMGLPTWDKPQMPCLASRLPYGTAITAEILVQVGSAEQELWNLGLRHFRVRYHEEIARIEVVAEELGKLLEPSLRERAAAALKRRGFKFVVVDLEPFRSGRLNEAAGIVVGRT
jgi:uncharacterized protein